MIRAGLIDPRFYSAPVIGWSAWAHAAVAECTLDGKYRENVHVAIMYARIPIVDRFIAVFIYLFAHEYEHNSKIEEADGHSMLTYTTWFKNKQQNEKSQQIKAHKRDELQ